MSPDQLAVLHDARLSREARLMALHVSGLGDGFHAVSHGEFRRMLGRGARGMPKRQTLAGYIQELQEYGWFDRKPGGSGSPRYRFTVPPGYGSVPSHGGTPRPVQSLEGTSSSPMEGPQSLARASTTSKPPPPKACGKAKEFVKRSEALKGCRDSLCDYLMDRVDTERQLAYAQTVAGYIQGTDEAIWMMPGGSHVTDDRQAIIAGCLNELRGGDEIGRYFPGPPGDVGNLRSKIRYKVKALAGAAKDKPKSRRSGALFPEAEPPTEVGAA